MDGIVTDTFDFSKITLHQAKRKEMDSQVRVLELESNLDKERRKLSELRKTHYQLAGESGGWDQEVIFTHFVIVLTSRISFCER